MTVSLGWMDFSVLGIYFAGLTFLGAACARRTKNSDHFVAAGRAVPGWALALTLFGSFVSSISFLAQPGKSYADNWSPFVFCFSLPVAAAIGARIFVPFFRRSGEVSAYAHLERRFGPWARTYAVTCFILLQLTRTGVVAYLLSLALLPAFGGDPSDPATLVWIILAVGFVMTVFPLVGGTDAAIWTGVAQSLVLMLGILVSLGTVLWRTPGGPGRVFQIAAENHKFSLGSWDLSFAGPTVLVIFLYSLTENLRNFGINQTYVQLYSAARSERDARACVWMGASIYIPLAAATYLVGTALYAFYVAQPGLLPEGIPPDRVFPHFIHTQLPAGLRGLVVAGVCAAATDSGFNYVATLIQGDFYKRYFRPSASDRESLRVLRLSTLACGAVSTAVALAMMRAKQALDAWWNLAGIVSGGMLGLFLLGLICPRAGWRAGLVGVIGGTGAIIAMASTRPPWHEFMIPVLGTAGVIGLGILTHLFERREAP